MKNTSMSDDFPSLNFLCSRVHSCECEGIHEDAQFSLSRQTYSTCLLKEHLLYDDGYLTGFPRFQGRKKYEYFLFGGVSLQASIGSLDSTQFLSFRGGPE
jgi:hypothetical protein